MNEEKNAANNGGESGKQPKKVGTLPKADVDFMDVSTNVAASWVANPQITLLWKKSDVFKMEVDSYCAELGSRIQTGSKRPGFAHSLIGLDKQVNVAVKEVRVYIAKKFKTPNAPAQYARYGIVKQNDAYVLPVDRNQRKAALTLMVQAIAADGFGDEEYGLNFWKEMEAAYKVAVAESGGTAGTVSVSVATKNVQKRGIRKVLVNLRKAVEANYPDTYREVLRKWGWQKETY